MPEPEKQTCPAREPFFSRLKTRLKQSRERRRLANRLFRARRREKKAAIFMEYLGELKTYFPDAPPDTSDVEWLQMIFAEHATRRRAYTLLWNLSSPQLDMDLKDTLHPDVLSKYNYMSEILWLKNRIRDWKQRRRVKKLLGDRSRDEVLKLAPYSYDWDYGADGYHIYDDRKKRIISGAASPELAESWILERYLCEIQGLPKSPHMQDYPEPE